ncbi:MAG: DNA-3-methyladenine glycosylase, partial [Verrucomicrobiales bacterium]|nr:DNA-3-methyladenine glycosylase [Verrucomicrobiales bacterium]
MQAPDTSETEIDPGAFRRLPRAFYDRDTTVVAQELLGHWMVRRVDGVCRIGRIVETEAYL